MTETLHGWIARGIALLALVSGCDFDLPAASPLRHPSRRTSRRSGDPSVIVPNRHPGRSPVNQVGNPNVALGVPIDTSPQDELLLVHPQFTLSHNRFRNGPNWVAWRLRADDLGSTGRTQDRFSPDPMLPEGVYAVRHGDYSGSGYDRGHLCPSSSRTADPDDNAATFLTTNLLPQKHGLNAGAWEALEAWCSEAARRGRDVFIVAGGLWDAACATDLSPAGAAPGPACQTVGRSDDIARRVAVPRGFWKIVVLLDRDQGPGDLRGSSEVLAVEMPNDGSAGADWRRYLTTVDAIERDTGYDFLPAVAVGLQRVIEARVSSP